MEQEAEAAESTPQNKIQALKKETDVVIDKMMENMEKALIREEKANDLLNISREVEEEAAKLKRTTANVERSYWWKNVKLIVAVVVVVLIVVLIIILLATGVIPVNASVPPVVASTIKP